jgi:serine/threonine protein kinase
MQTSNEATAPADPLHLVGRRIGHYEILDVLGHGGMGVVYRARQDHPQRVVALKVVAAGVTSDAALKRFGHEVEFLGRLQHPGIAQVFEAGTFDLGRGPQPFFAMELIEGTSLLTFAAQQHLDARARLGLIVKICHAVEHAHQKGVIHRDLKPGNVLVNAEGQPKILDFGVARATDGDLRATTIRTDIGQLIGTIPYMSPEQAGGDQAALDTRSDVYALGVIAYELLSGRLPYDLKSRMIHEAVRVIREDDPTPLSSIDRSLHGDVEIIVGKALAKEKEGRYASAEEMAADITRYLRDEPIVARPPSTWYQARKFARRNKALVGGIAATFVALLAGLVASLVLLGMARESERVAKYESTQRGIAERAERERADELEKVTKFQSNMITALDPNVIGLSLFDDLRAQLRATLEAEKASPEIIDSEISRVDALQHRASATDLARALVDRHLLGTALAAVNVEFKDQPKVDASLRQTLADAYQSLGMYEQAMPLQTEALEARRRILGEEHPDTLASLSGMGLLLTAMGEFDEAAPIHERVFESRRRVLGEDHRDTLSAGHNVAALHFERGDYSTAERLMREAIDHSHRLNLHEDETFIRSLSALATIVFSRGDFEQGVALNREVLDLRRRVLGDDHPDTYWTMMVLSQCLEAKGENEESEMQARAAMDGLRRVRGNDHPETLAAISRYSALLFATGRYEEALALDRAALDSHRRVLGPTHDSTLQMLNNLSGNLFRLGHLDESLELLAEALAGYRTKLGDTHAATLKVQSNLGFLLRRLSREEEAELQFRQVYDARASMLGPEHPDTIASMNYLAIILTDLNRLDEAEPLAAESVRLAREILPEGHPETGFYLGNHARCLMLLRRFTEAEAAAMESHDCQATAWGPSHPRSIGAVTLIAQLYDAWHSADPDKGYDLKAAEWRAKLPPPSTSETGSGQ